MGDRLAKDALYGAFARVGQALGNGHRVELVDVLAQGERSVDELSREIGQSVANTSQHLRVLARAGLVRTRRDGARVRYRLAGDDVELLWATLRDVAQHHVADVDVLAGEYLGVHDELETIGVDELALRLEQGDVVLLDVRPRAEHAAAHIPGARHVDLDALGDLASSLSADADVVAYCRGPYCVFAHDAVRLLAERGVRARRLDGGLPEWRRADHPVAGGT
jgi:rhodanese-related sulfurtransferase/DNA-binding HxlR family transcriptional regulator